MTKIINGVASEYDIPMKYENKTMTIEVKNDEMLGRTTDSTLHIELIKLQQENQQLKEKINTYENPEDLTLMFMYCDEKAKDKIEQLKEKVDYLKNKCENKDKWCQLIADIGYDYDGYTQADSLMKLIDELVKYAIWSRDNYDYDAFQKENNNE